MKEFEIWIGYYHMGQGYDPSTEPKLLCKIIAKDFKTACFKYELKTNLESIEKQEKAGKYIGQQDYEWFFNPHTISNSWLGKYYESKEEAQKSFL